MRQLYPSIAPFHQEMFDVGQGHKLYLEQSGNPNGIPVLYLHGGPGAGLPGMYPCLFDPEKYWIIGFDQRGCGRSTPFSELTHNTTEHQLGDIEAIRVHLGIKKWILCGGSWGATLSLLAAIANPGRILAMVLRGTFLSRQQDLDWYLEPDGGAAQMFPEHYSVFIQTVQDRACGESLVSAYYRKLTQASQLTQTSAAKAWCLWEEQISQLNSRVEERDLSHHLHQISNQALLECHYLYNRCFIPENFILDNIHKISTIPGTLIHGRFDVLCKMEAAYSLRQRWQNSQLFIVPEAGHSLSEPGIAEAICYANDAMVRFIEEKAK